MSGSEAPVPKKHKGHIIVITRENGKLLAKVKLDDGPHKGETGWVDHNNTPPWVSRGVRVECDLAPIGRGLDWIAINVTQEET